MKTVSIHLDGQTEATKGLAMVQAARRHGVKVQAKASRRGITVTVPSDALGQPLFSRAMCSQCDTSSRQNRRAINRINALAGR